MRGEKLDLNAWRVTEDLCALVFISGSVFVCWGHKGIAAIRVGKV